MDDSKLLFNTNWVLDQIIKQGTVTLTIASADWSTRQTIVDFSDLGLTKIPMFMMTSRPVGQTKWQMQGAGSAYNAGNHSPIFPVATTTKLSVYGGDVGTAYEIRYYLFKQPAVTT